MTHGALDVRGHQICCPRAVAGFESLENRAMLFDVVFLPPLGPALLRQ